MFQQSPVHYLIGYLLGLTITLPNFVVARFCEGGHICSLPRECCTQGCCPPYQNGPRQLPPATDHVLNLFFINHWYFWCVVVAIVLAILCIYSLWKKRHQVCGWGLSDHHAQSEGDSAGSCYAPPQYSRCNSFHHPPPPYTEVTSKPDLYPLVFTCNSDNGKNGASYLMVQYFRNYIVRPAGSLSATSTVDSLSSSFICNANEANTLVPPPYSRAASPENNGINSQYQQHFMIPRSASQLIYSQDSSTNNHHHLTHPTNRNTTNTNIVTNNDNNNFHIPQLIMQKQQSQSSSRGTNAANDTLNSTQNLPCSSSNSYERSNIVISSQNRDQQFRYNITNSNRSLSDIFVNNLCSGGINNDLTSNQNHNNKNNNNINNSHSHSNGTITDHHNHHQSNKNLVYLNQNNSAQYLDNNPVYNSCGSIGGISITVPVATDGDSEYRDLDVLRRSLETCCKLLQQQQQLPSANNLNNSSADSPVHLDLGKKFDCGIQSYINSTTCSAVSSLANIDSPSSPPQATSPTGEVRDVLDQIRQLQIDNSFDDNLDLTIDSITNSTNQGATAATTSSSLDTTIITTTTTATATTSKRPATLQTKKKFFSKSNKGMYIPINAPNIKLIRSPVSATNFFSKNRGRKSWISRSAPTTPGTSLPPNRLSDDSPLLNEHDEHDEHEDDDDDDEDHNNEQIT